MPIFSGNENLWWGTLYESDGPKLFFTFSLLYSSSATLHPSGLKTSLIIFDTSLNVI